jgi:hypothetical protein
MNAQVLSGDSTVAQALEAAPEIGRVLISRHTACVGCYMARFCTLQDSASAYGLAWDGFMSEIKTAASNPTLNNGEGNA